MAPEEDDSEDDEDNYNDTGTGARQWSKNGAVYGFGRTNADDGDSD